MEKIRLIPKVRFDGYTDVWEQRKVYEITSVVPSKQYLSEASENGKYEVIQQGDNPVLGYADGNPFIDYEKITMFGDHTLSLYKAKSPFFVASDGLKLLYSDGMDGGFYFYLLEKYKPESEGYKRHFSILKECGCSYPNSKIEQERIGRYFRELDNLITLHQRKLEKLLDYKIALAEKMFPSVGQQPELRIINEGLWAEVTIADIGDYFSTDTLSYADLVEDGRYKCLLYGDLYTKYNEKIFDVKLRTNKSATKLAKNDILFPTSTTVDALSLIAPSCVCEDDVHTGGDLFGIRPKVGISGTFISYYINNKHSIKNSFARNAQGLTIVHIHYDNIKNERIMIPDYREQVAIVSLFSSLDNLINAEKNFVEKLKVIKKAFLDKMFVKVEV